MSSSTAGLAGISRPIPGYFLNCDFIKWRPYKDAYMIPLEIRHSVNQAASISLIYSMVNLTCRGQQFQGSPHRVDLTGS